MVEVIQFFVWLLIVALIIAVPIVSLMILIRHDSTAYDLEFIWGGKYTPEQLLLLPPE